MIPTLEVSRISIELSHIVLTLIGRRHDIHNVRKTQVQCRSRKLKSSISLSPRIKFGIKRTKLLTHPKLYVTQSLLEKNGVRLYL
jgi:hypothetical protein